MRSIAIVILVVCGGISAGAAVNTRKLVDAVRERNDAEVQTLVAQRADPNTAQGDGATAIHWAAHWDDLKTAELLIHAGANVNATDDEGVTPLSLACINANPAMVALFLKAGANPNKAQVNGETPLMISALTGSAEIVNQLLSRGADANARELSRGQTALMRAVARNHPEAASALIAGGADVKARSGNRFTALLFAAQQGSVEAARILLKAGADVNDTAPDGVGGDTNARVMFKPNTEAGALLVAIDSSHPEMAKFLIDNGANVNDHGAGRTALHAAVQQAMPDVVTLLLDHGADPNARLEKPLPLLSRFIHQDSGMEVDSIGATPFWLAASYTDLRMMRILAGRGADTRIVSRDKTTPLMVAAGVDFVDGQDKYGRRWFQDSMPLQLAALEALKLCMTLGNDINDANANGQTALHGATYFGSTLLVQFLYENGAKLDAQNKFGQTPYVITQGLYLAGSFTIRKDAGDLLLKLGADPLPGGDHPLLRVNGKDAAK